jgi:flagellar biosynthesis/type III secretory pathway protein FliH
VSGFVPLVPSAGFRSLGVEPTRARGDFQPDGGRAAREAERRAAADRRREGAAERREDRREAPTPNPAAGNAAKDAAVAEAVADARAAMDAERARLAEESGRMAAEADHLAAERERLTTECARLGALASGLEEAQRRLVRELRGELGPVILEAARAIAGDALHVETRLLDALVTAAMDALGRDDLVLRVAPIDAEGLRARLPGVDVREDARIEAGCIASGPAGSLDASLGRAVEAVGQAIARWREVG